MSDKFKQAIHVADGAWQLLQHFVCRDYKTSQRGNGAGGVHSRHNAHRLYPKNMTEVMKQPPDTSKEKCDGKFKIKMVNPAQATVEQAKSEAKQLRETTHGKAPQSSIKGPRGHNSVKPKKKKRKYNDTVFQNGVF